MDIEEFRTYCLSFAGTHDDFPFGKAVSEYDRNLLVFYVGDKWFCFVNAVEFDRCTLKCAPERVQELCDRYEGIGPGYHMNKRCWIGVGFGQDVPDPVIRELVKNSYELVVAGLTKNQRARLAEVEEQGPQGKKING